MNVAIFILAGGKSSRMQQDKGLMLFRGKALVKYIVDTLTLSQFTTNIIANNDGYEVFGLPVFCDEIIGKGPIGGLYTALLHSAASHVLLLSCDMPMITIDSVKLLVNSAQDNCISIALINGRLNPLFALYPKTIREIVLQNIMQDQLKMVSLVESFPNFIIDFDNKNTDSTAEFVNFNYPEDIINFEAHGK